MKTYLECLPCFVSQTVRAAQILFDNENDRKEVISETLRILAGMDYNQPPPLMKHKIDRVFCDKIGNYDPYFEDKIRFNNIALELYPELKRRIEVSLDPWETGVRLSAAGNTIDLGVYGIVEKAAIDQAIDFALTQPIPLHAVDKLRRKAEEAESILFIGDNAGEIVFDRLLIEMLPKNKVTFAVRGKPTINDALMKDAVDTGIADLVKVIDSGIDIPGTIPELSSPEMNAELQKADLIIAKGQGNFETLSDYSSDICFLFKVKCEIIARDSGIEKGKIAVMWGENSN